MKEISSSSKIYTNIAPAEQNKSTHLYLFPLIDPLPTLPLVKLVTSIEPERKITIAPIKSNLIQEKTVQKPKKKVAHIHVEKKISHYVAPLFSTNSQPEYVHPSPILLSLKAKNNSVLTEIVPKDSSLLKSNEDHSIISYVMNNYKMIAGTILTVTLATRNRKSLIKLLKNLPKLANTKWRTHLWKSFKGNTFRTLLNPAHKTYSVIKNVFAGKFKTAWEETKAMLPKTVAATQHLIAGNLKLAWQALKQTPLINGIKHLFRYTKYTAAAVGAPAAAVQAFSQAELRGSRENRITPISDITSDMNALRTNPDAYMAHNYTTTYLTGTQKPGAEYANGVLLKLDTPLSDQTPYMRRLPADMIEALKAAGYKTGSKGEILCDEKIAENGIYKAIQVAYFAPYRDNPSQENYISTKIGEGSTATSYSVRKQWRFGPRDGAGISFQSENTVNYTYGAAPQSIIQYAAGSFTQSSAMDIRQQQTNYAYLWSRKFMAYDGELSGVNAMQPTQYAQYGQDISMGGFSIYNMEGLRHRLQIGVNNPAKGFKLNESEMRARLTGLSETGAMLTFATYKNKENQRYSKF